MLKADVHFTMQHIGQKLLVCCQQLLTTPCGGDCWRHYRTTPGQRWVGAPDSHSVHLRPALSPESSACRPNTRRTHQYSLLTTEQLFYMEHYPVIRIAQTQEFPSSNCLQHLADWLACVVVTTLRYFEVSLNQSVFQIIYANPTFLCWHWGWSLPGCLSSSVVF